MTAPRWLGRTLPWLTLRATRARVHGRWRAFAALVALAVAWAEMTAGGMLSLQPTQGIYTVEVLRVPGASTWWFYPEGLIVQPWGIVQLPWLPTVAMALVALGAGLGSAASIQVVVAWWRRRRAQSGSASMAGIAAGAGPGVASLASLGACCCTSCSSAAGLAIVAAASGTSVGTLYQVDWYLPIFQLGVVYLSLLAQERALRRTDLPDATADPRGGAFVVGALLRLVLLIAGTTWSLAMFVEWGSIDPANASSALWYHWIFEHQLLSFLAIGAALFPGELAKFVASTARRGGSWLLRSALAVPAVTWGIGVPPALRSLGLGGFVNELLGAAGVGPGQGGLRPEVAFGPALLFHWGFQHLALAGFALLLALDPSFAVRPLLATLSPGSPLPGEPAGAPASSTA